MHLDCYIPDMIIGLSRGGLDMAVKLSHYFDVPMYPFKLQLRADGDFNESSLSIESKFKNVLIVDDICDSGETFERMAEILSEHNKTVSFKFATAIENMDCNFKCDYNSKQIFRSEDKQWLIFPWEEIL